MLIALAGLGAVGCGAGAGSGAAVDLTVQRAVVGQPIPSSFVGVSIEYPDLIGYAGSGGSATDPLFEQLIRNLAPYGAPSIRIGGDTTDWTWWPIRGMRQPDGIRFSLSHRWLDALAAVVKATGAHVLLGINLEANSTRIADAEVRHLTAALGRESISGFEIGNEPELYGSFAWYIRNGKRYYGRPSGYRFADFMSDFTHVARTVPHAPLAGPDIGGPEWMPYLGRFLRGEPRVSLATLHRYPLKRCRPGVRRTLSELLANSSSTGLADGMSRYAATAHAAHVPLRIDEMNAVSCGGQPGVSNSFGAALWSVDSLFSLADVGVDGVNIHTRPRTSGELFTITHRHGRWRATIHPEYYGLVMFAQAAPPGARLLRIAGSASRGLRVWATADAGEIRVALINKSVTDGHTVTVRIPGAAGAAYVERLEAPSATSTGDVTFGGHVALARQGDGYTLRLPAASAALLSVAETS